MSRSRRQHPRNVRTHSLDGEIRDGRHFLTVRVYYEDTDFPGIVYHANFLRYMERGRTNRLRLIAADHRALKSASIILHQRSELPTDIFGRHAAYLAPPSSEAESFESVAQQLRQLGKNGGDALGLVPLSSSRRRNRRRGSFSKYM